MKKLNTFLLLSMFLLLAMPIGVWGASAGGTATGAKLPDYKTVVTKTIDSTSGDFSYILSRYLSEAAQKASKNTQYKIIISPGTYTTRYCQDIPSNTWIYAKGATIRALKGRNRMVLLSNWSTEKSTENIVIEGGTWDTTTQSINDSSETAPFRLAHAKNLIIKDMIIKSNRKSHLIEVSDINGMTIEGCKISGNDGCTDVQPKEAIQLDVATKPAMVNMTPYNGKGCHNILIQNNSFNKVARGVGSHNEMTSDVESNPYTQVTIRNNSFKNLKGEAIYIKWGKFFTIEKNTVQNGTRSGIFMESCSKAKIANNSIKKIKAFTGERKKTYGAATAGIILRNCNSNSIQENVLSQCKGKVVRIEISGRGNSIKNNKKK